jgi:methionine-rich copper-binding protein CopC
MKSTIKTYGIVAIALIAFTLVFSTSTLANNDKEKSTANIELKFIGHYENQPVFQLNLNNAQEDEFTITFRDDYGNVLYAAKVKGSNISKKFMLNTEEIGDNALSVEVKAKKNDKSEVYQINRVSSLVEETTVNKIK